MENNYQKDFKSLELEITANAIDSVENWLTSKGHLDGIEGIEENELKGIIPFVILQNIGRNLDFNEILETCISNPPVIVIQK